MWPQYINILKHQQALQSYKKKLATNQTQNHGLFYDLLHIKITLLLFSET